MSKDSFQPKNKKFKFPYVPILSYLRELSVVIIGIFVTLGISDLVTYRTKQKEIKESLLLIKMELQENNELLQQFKNVYDKEMYIFNLLSENMEHINNIPSDTLSKYIPHLGNYSIFIPSRDAYEIFKSSTLHPQIKNKSFLLELSKTYSALDELNRSTNNYTNQKKGAMETLVNDVSDTSKKLVTSIREKDPYSYYSIYIKDDRYKGFIFRSNHIIYLSEFHRAQSKIENVLEILDQEYLN